MRVKEWFGWHFPELSKIVSDNSSYIKTVKLIKNKENLLADRDALEVKLVKLLEDEETVAKVFDAAKASMGGGLNELDELNIKYFCKKVSSLIQFKEQIHEYLKEKMLRVCPNTAALIGEIVCARLLAHAGGLSTLAKYPASTIQILGAEKALFRALKTKSKTPKYGILYHSSFIGKANASSKGKISRFLANKISMCSRIDFFSADRFADYGEELRNQVEERLEFLNSGIKPRKNLDVMGKIFEQVEEKKLLGKKKASKASRKLSEGILLIRKRLNKKRK